VLSLIAIAVHLIARSAVGHSTAAANYPLWTALALGGLPLVLELALKLFRGQFGSDLLAGISIVTSVVLGEYLAGTLVVLMLSGGEALESYAVRSASSVLNALVKRMPSVAHRQSADGALVEIAVADVQVGDHLLVLPHETCPVDGVVVAGHGSMDEAYLTGEPYQMSKSVGSEVISGAINGEAALTIEASRLAVDSRYAKIMRVMEQSEQQRPRLRRLGDQLGAWYTPLAVAIGLAAWAASGNPVRFLAVLVVATPCPLLIAIPVVIIGSISLAARRGIIIRDPAILERIGGCRTMIFDKTGTLTYGEPQLTEQLTAAGADPRETLALAASLEQYSKHPLAAPLLKAARAAGIALRQATEVRERPGEGLRGVVDGRQVQVTSRKQAAARFAGQLPPIAAGLECVILIDGQYAATYRFRDRPRAEGVSFVNHLSPHHHFSKLMLVSGDRASEVEHLAEQLGITDVHAETSPEEKLEIVRRETSRAQTIYVGDGINDAPALLASTVGVAMGQKSEVTSEAAGAVVLDNSLRKVDELLHIGRRMRSIALQSAVGGMALSLVGMLFAAFGYLPPVAGALLQEAIDVAAVLNALRAAIPPRQLTDFE
jgi:heavy metal translocating P-type ATPase